MIEQPSLAESCPFSTARSFFFGVLIVSTRRQGMDKNGMGVLLGIWGSFGVGRSKADTQLGLDTFRHREVCRRFLLLLSTTTLSEISEISEKNSRRKGQSSVLLPFHAYYPPYTPLESLQNLMREGTLPAVFREVNTRAADSDV